MIAGKPLIAWTIEAAKAANTLDRFVVSTEDKEIAQVAKNLGVEVMVRPAELASDTALTMDVLKHILAVLGADIIVLLQPTSPIRNPGLIDECVRRFRASGKDDLATGFICKYKPYGSCQKRRQDLQGFFYDDGNVYVIKADLIRNGGELGQNSEQFEISREQNIEIDDEFDFWLAEQILLK
jgi:CMP-N-acetylneuraminic acid synthetase